MTTLDWTIIVIMYTGIVAAVQLTRGRMRGVADYLAAGRLAGRYLLTISAGIAGLGAITVVANLEMGFEAGFAQYWWGLTTAVVHLAVMVTGWVTYRFRRTRALTLAEFFERRYSRRFRIFAGSVAFGAGLINFGIFPAVGARFFIHFLALPEVWQLGPLAIPVFPAIMAILLTTAVYFVLAGGQVAVIVTDFIQGTFANLVFLAVALFLLLKVGWGDVGEVLSQTAAGHSKINPYDTGFVADFNFSYFMIGAIGLLYGAMSWQGTQAYYSSARTAHEGKMGGVLTLWRNRSQETFLTLIPILIFTVMRHPDWSGVADEVRGLLGAIDNEAVRGQMRGPVALATLLPRGLVGAFAALMVGAFISTHNTYLHSWSSIFIQDVVLPFRRKPLSPQAHLRLLRGAVVGVALFIFGFSLLYKQSQAILLFFALTGAIFAGWAGAVIIGGLYTRWGTTAAAWTASITGVALTVSGFALEQAQRVWREDGTAFWGLLDWAGPARALDWAAWVNVHLPNGQILWGWAMWICTALYVLVSLGQKYFGHQASFDLDRLLHRGKYEIAGEVESGTGHTGRTSRGWRALAITDEFSRRDKILYLATYAWSLGWVLVFIVGTVFFLTREINNGDWSAYDSLWLGFWHTKLWLELGISAVVIVWFTIGGVRDIKALLRGLDQRSAVEQDDGIVK
ncbi:MAG: sodium:solute symporter [Candidatus Krumholzibacteria bacterium]|nr:sodium:solute symporter [Candidatus Krumholzibacteria bacterium]